MNKSANRLTASSGFNPYFWVLILAGLVAYVLPWVANPGVSLTLGAYDLAEWTSLARDVDMMNTVLLLRLLPVFLVWIAALAFGYPRLTRKWWLTLLFVLLMTAALLPPIEFLQDTGNTNYRQQLMVAGLAFIGGIVGLTGLLPRLRPLLIIVLSVVAIVVGIMGANQALNFMWALKLPARAGLGSVLFIVVVMMVAFSAVGQYLASADAKA